MGPPSKMNVPVSFHGLRPKHRPSQSTSILSSVFSKLHSLDAKSLISISFARCCGTFLSMSRCSDVYSSFCSVNPAMPITSVIASQCRSRNPGLHTAPISGGAS